MYLEFVVIINIDVPTVENGTLKKMLSGLMYKPMHLVFVSVILILFWESAKMIVEFNRPKYW